MNSDIDSKPIVFYSNVLFTEDFDVDTKKSGENILKLLQTKFDDLKIGSSSLKKLMFVTDRGSNILSFLKTLKCTHFHCNTHLLNSILKETFDEQFLTNNLPDVNLLITVCKQLVKYLKKSGDVKKLDSTVHQECVTRWNTTWKMLDSVHRNFKQISLLYKNTPKQAMIDSVDVNLLQKIISFLKPFKVATEKLEVESKTMFLFVPFILEDLKRHLNSFILPDNNIDFSDISDVEEENVDDGKFRLQELARRAINSFDKLIQIDITHNVAAFLHPKYNELKWLDRNGRKEVKKYVKTFLSKSNDSSASTSSDSSEHFDDEYSSYANCIKTTAPGETEYEMYKQQLWTDMPILEFWKQNENRYPNLSQLARKLLPIPPSSSSSERVFSTAGRVIEERRTLLNPESLDAILFLHNL